MRAGPRDDLAQSRTRNVGPETRTSFYHRLDERARQFRGFFPEVPKKRPNEHAIYIGIVRYFSKSMVPVGYLDVSPFLRSIDVIAILVARRLLLLEARVVEVLVECECFVDAHEEADSIRPVFGRQSPENPVAGLSRVSNAGLAAG